MIYPQYQKLNIGYVASSSNQRVDSPAGIAKDKSEKPTQPVSIDYLLSVFGKGSLAFNLYGTNSFHGLNIQKAWMLIFVSHAGFSSIAIQMMRSLRTGSGTGNMPWVRKGCSQIIQLVMFTLNS